MTRACDEGTRGGGRIAGVALALVAVAGLAVALAAGCAATQPGTWCVDAQTLKTCICLEDAPCSCSNTSCQPGSCVSPPQGTAFCATSPDPWPGCSSTQAIQSLCDGTALFQCRFGYRVPGSPCSGICVTAGGGGICSVSIDPSPACDPARPSQQLCDGNTFYECQYGYRTTPLAPGRGGFCPADQRCSSDGNVAACVPRA